MSAITKKHVFITGEIQVGKSTIIQKTIRELALVPGGFLTSFLGELNHWPKKLVMSSVTGQQVQTAALLNKGEPPKVFTEVFDGLGVELLRRGQELSSLILMDECGRFEGQAAGFKRQVFSILDSDIPVLGVVRSLPYATWLDEIKAHPTVTLVEVTRENRDGLSDYLTALFSQWL